MEERVSYVAFPPAAAEGPTVAARMAIPEAEGRRPSVVICHGSDGVDGRGEFHARALRGAGLATLEIDMWAARGVVRGAAARPSSPLLTLPDAFGALAFLRAQPEIDPARIAILGFSWGGAMSLLAATQGRATPLLAGASPFAAHVAFYPVCWAYLRLPELALRDLTGSPILVVTGGRDAYDPPGAARALVADLRSQGTAKIAWREFAPAGHAFDRHRPTRMIVDPFAHAGAGGEVEMAFHRRAAEQARRLARDFLVDALA